MAVGNKMGRLPSFLGCELALFLQVLYNALLLAFRITWIKLKQKSFIIGTLMYLVKIMKTEGKRANQDTIKLQK